MIDSRLSHIGLLSEIVLPIEIKDTALSFK